MDLRILPDSSKSRNQGLGQADKTVWCSCRKETQRVRDCKINKSDVGKKFPEIENLMRQGGKIGLEPRFTTEPGATTAKSKAGAGAFSVSTQMSAWPVIYAQHHSPLRCHQKEPADVPSAMSRGKLNPSKSDGWQISISILYVQTDRASSPSCQNTGALSTVQQGVRGKERGENVSVLMR